MQIFVKIEQVKHTHFTCFTIAIIHLALKTKMDAYIVVNSTLNVTGFLCQIYHKKNIIILPFLHILRDRLSDGQTTLTKIKLF